MRSVHLKSALLKSALAASVLLVGGGTAFGQQQINLAAGPAMATLPDGSQVPMWGYTCGAVVAGSTATCAALNPNAGAGWSPVVITVPAGASGGLQINLTNNLSFMPDGATTANNIPTSLTIVGQLGGGLGTSATTAPSPVHAPQGATWFIAGDTNGVTFTPPAQPPRVQSFGTEVEGAGYNGTLDTKHVASGSALTWPNLRPGTYLIESGTHPSIQGPMGLYGILVVTTAPSGTTAGTAYGVPGASNPATYSAEVPLLMSEIDPVQNTEVQAAVMTAGFAETAVNVLRSQVGSVVPAVDASGNVINAGTGYKVGDPVLITMGGGSGATAQVSQVDGVGAIVAITVLTAGSNYSSTPTATAGGSGTGAVLSVGLAISTNTIAHCSDGANAVAACYPPAVNYTPLYYLFNGVAFDKTHIGGSLFQVAPATGVTGSVLVRLVNAGLRMHVPSIVGSTTGTAGTAGMALIAEDGNVLPGVPRVQSEVFMAAGKTYDVMINAPQPTGMTAPAALPIFDRELSLSGNAINRDAGMLAYIGVNGAGTPAAGSTATASAQANPDTYNALVTGQPLAISDPSKGVIANDLNVYGVTLLSQAASGTVVLNANGTFTYTPNAGSTATSDSFTYCANTSATVAATACPTNLTAAVTLGASAVTDSGITCTASTLTFNSNLATYYLARTPGLLGSCTDAAGLPMTVTGVVGAAAATPLAGTFTGGSGTVTVDHNGGFAATAPAAGTYEFDFVVQNSKGTQTATYTATIVFPVANGPAVKVLDGNDKTTVIADYRWIIEEDRTFYVDPKCAKNPLPAGCPATNSTLGTPFNFGTNFHTSFMPVVASGCTGPLSCEQGQTLLGVPAACDIGSGVCETTNSMKTAVSPSQVNLDPNKRYYISVLPGDAANPFIGGNTSAPTNCAQGEYNADGSLNTNCGHGMGGAPLAPGQSAVTILTQPSPYPPAKLSVFVFQDDNPLNGEHDAGGGVDVLAPAEAGLGGFEILLSDDAGGTGDATGQPTYDMFNQPLTNGLAGTIDPVTNLDACPISPVVTNNALQGDGTQKGIIGMIVTCPKYESDGATLSPLAGQAIVPNLYQGRYGVIANPGADRIARGEEWLQTNTLDGQKAHDSFMRIGEPGYFQEFGPAGYHVTIGFANPQIINQRRLDPTNKTGMCDPLPNGGALNCNNTVTGLVTTARMSRPPDERLYGSGDRNGFAFTQCYAALGEPDGATFAFTKCASDGTFTFTNLPAGNWKLTIFDQWNDQIVDGISTPVALNCSNTNPGQCTGTSASAGTTVNLGEIASHQWQSNIYTTTFFDANKDGVREDSEAGLALVATNNRFRDGSFSNFNNTDLNGFAGYNEIFPLFNWYVIETDTTRYKTTGVHVVYDSGGPVDGSSPGGTPCNATGSVNPCGSSNIGASFANTFEKNPLPTDLRLPGARYCATADCASGDTGFNPGSGASYNQAATGSTGRVDPPYVWGSYAWQGFSGQANFIEWGKTPYVPGETGGIHGHVVYASTRPFDDPQLLLQLSWESLVPHVRVNLYREDVAADGVSTTLTLVDHTDTTSFDDWMQGFRAGTHTPNISCPGQSTSDPFWYGLQNQPQWLDFYNNVLHGTSAAAIALPYNAQFKCYDGMHNWNQVQPAPYDGMYNFPSVLGFDPATGRPSGTNCTACVTDPDSSDPYRFGTPMLPAGTYVVEVVVPPGYELVKEEDKNILIGDNFIAPVAVQFPGVGGSVFILPDQAEVGANYNANNPQNPTQGLGRVQNLPSHEGDTGSVETFWPCVGELRQVPDFLSIFPQSGEVSPFAGAVRHLCDRKEVTLTDQSSALAKFYIFSSTHVASHFTGVISDDFTAEFDPFSPQFGEKFGPAYLPVSVKDWTGNEINRVYTDAFGYYNGLNYSTWEVDPPNPTGYGPTMMVMCMNDSGAGTSNPAAYNPAWLAGTSDPFYQPNYSQFCYELPFMPGTTGYFDTPVTPTSAFSEGYNHPDCSYPDATPAIASVTSSAIAGPWVQPASAATRAIATFTVSGVARCTTTSCINPSSIAFPGGTVICTSTGTGGPSCAASSGIGRNNSVASYIQSHITTLMGNTGYTASVTGGVTVTVNAPATGASFNGTAVVTAANNVTGPVPTIRLAGGTDATSASMALTITALGDQQVDNFAYSGPSIPTAPFNQQRITRHYGFGSDTGNVGLMGSDGVLYPLTGVSWSNTQITGTVTTTNAGHTLPNCLVEQQAIYGGSTAKCGQLVITTAATAGGKTSVDTVTVTVGGKKPTVLAAGKTIQSAIDTARPGDMIIVPPGVYNEMVLMWKPVRLQGVGATSSVIDANTQPAGKLLDPWRKEVVCLFGLTQDGRPNAGSTQCSMDLGLNYGGTGASSAAGGPNFPGILVDRVPFEAVLGWDATLNGNLAEQLIEPSLMGAYEGAAITVLGKGIKLQASDTDPFGSASGGAYTAGTTLLLQSDCLSRSGQNPYPGNFYCNPSGIDGLTLRDSSQGGGGIFVHAFAHNLQIANNRVQNNMGTMSGGMTIGTGEHPDVALAPVDPTTLTTYPGPCENSNTTNLALPFCYNMNVNIHDNAVTLNSSLGDELFSSSPAGAGGVTLNTGADYYKFTNNWVCGNMSTGDGGGVAHVGWSKNGTIAHNKILFNQSTNPTITTNGGGMLVMGAPDVDPTTCGVNNDQDCAASYAIGVSDGTGPGLTIDANLILGNSADSGSGGGLRFQAVNGNDIMNFPRGATSQGNNWNSVRVTNNIIVNNVAGWDGAGVSLLDALKVDLVNNTIVSNDATASSGALNNTLFAGLASAPPPPSGTVVCSTNGSTTIREASCPQVSGVVSLPNTPGLISSVAGLGLTCPAGHANCGSYSNPLLFNDLIWQNRSFYIGVGGLGDSAQNQNQQYVVALYNAFTSTLAPAQTSTGACPAPASYWDIGVRGNTGPTNQTGGALSPSYSVLTSTTGYASTNTAGNPNLVSQYCNGARAPVEAGAGAGITVNPGTNEVNALPSWLSQFTLMPAATVDEGNNWINMRWGPLSLVKNWSGNAPGTSVGPEVMLGNYAPGNASSSAVDTGTDSASSVQAPTTDFFGNARPQGNGFDIGAVESGFTRPVTRTATVTPTSLTFGTWASGTTSTAQTLTVTNTGSIALNGGAYPITGANSNQFGRPGFGGAGTCGATLAVGASCTVNVTFSPTSTGDKSATLTVSFTGTTVTGAAVSLSGTGAAIAVQPTALTFGNVAINTTSAAQTLTVHNATGTARSLGVVVTSPFSRPTGGAGGSCGTTLANNTNCTINIVYSPTSLTSSTGTVTITTNVGFNVANSPVTLTGTGAPQVVAATLTPTSWSPTATNGCTFFTCPAQTFTLTNTGNVSLTGVNNGTISGATEFTRLFSTCGGGGGTLAAGASCIIMVRFGPPAGDTGTKNATLSLTGSAGTQTATLTGTAN